MRRADGAAPLAAILADPQIGYHVAAEIRYGQTRALEVVLACIMVTFGLVLIAPEPTFTAPSYRIIASYVSERQAGTVSLLVGCVRIAALFVNGRRRHTPIPRTVGCLGGFAFWTALTVGFALAVPPLSTGLAVYPVLAVAELYSSRRAAADAFVLDSFGLRPALRRREARQRTLREDLGRDERAAGA